MRLSRIAHQFRSKLKITVQRITKARIVRFINEMYFNVSDDDVQEYINSRKPRA